MSLYTVDTAALTDGLARLAADLADRTKRASDVTADAIAREAQSRRARRTGETAAGIHREDSRDGIGSVVLATRATTPQLPYWLEYGTRYMTARPFLFASALLEEGPHEQRISEAIGDAIAATGFGG